MVFRDDNNASKIHTDGNSNTASCIFDVIVTDATNPTITCPANQTQTTFGTTVNLNDYTGMAIVGDNCSSNANISVTQSPAIGSTQTIGTVNITLTATDQCGNSSQCNFDVVINALDDASFNYSSSTFCLTGTDPTPTITGTSGGTFTATGGL